MPPCNRRHALLVWYLLSLSAPISLPWFFAVLAATTVIHEVLSSLPGGLLGAFIAVMALMFVLGFFLDFIEIVFVVVPIIAPVLIQLAQTRYGLA